MKRIFLTLWLFLISSFSYATQPALNVDTNVRFNACTPSDTNSNCAGASSGTVGIGTSGILSVYTGTTTVGPLANPSLCPAGQYATGILNTGAATGCTLSGGGSNYWELGSGNIGIATYGSGNNVGIGTITPNQQLTIGTTGQATVNSSGNFVTSGIYTTSNSGSSSSPNYQLSSGNGIYLDGANDVGVAVGGNDQDDFTSAGEELGRNTNASQTIEVINGNSGAGTVAEFQASNGTNNLTMSMFGTGFSSSNENIQGQATIDTGSGGLNFGADSGKMTWWTNSLERMRLTSGGNVGIGSTAPGQALDVNGIVRATSFTGSGSGITGLTQSQIAGLTTASSPTFAGITLSGLNVNSVVLTNGSSQLSSGTLSGNTTTVLTLNGTLTNGDIIIADPNSNAEDSNVALTAAGIVSLFSTCSGTQYLGADGACHNSGGGSNYWLLGTGGNIGVGTYANVGIGTVTGNAALSVMNGNVGIGTWNPSALFQVGNAASSTPVLQYISNGSSSEITLGDSNSTMTIQDNSATGSKSGSTISYGNTSSGSGSNAILYGSQGSTGGFLKLESANNSTPTGDYISFVTGNSTNADSMRIVGNGASLGNVGIGTTIPQGALTVMSGNVGIGTWIPNKLFDLGTGHNFTIDSTGLITLAGASTLSSTALSGNVNGGTFSVANTSGGTGSSLILKGGGSASSHMDLYSTSGNGVGGSYIKMLVGNNGGTEAMRITDGGNIGIGTTVPGATVAIGTTACKTGIGDDVCWGTSTSGAACLGYCTAGTFPTCSTCTCC